MPLYEYECDACHHRFEVIQKFSDPPVGVCPACGGGVHKLLSSPAIQFKGSGWYITDYARAGKGDTSDKGEKSGKESGAPAGDGAGSSAASSEGASESTTKSETKSESKAETKSEAKPSSSSKPSSSPA